MPLPEDLTDEQFEKLGARAAEIFELRRDPFYAQDRWVTSWGSKTNQGIGRVMLRLVTEAASSAQSD